LSETFFDKTYIFRNIQGFRPFLYTLYVYVRDVMEDMVVEYDEVIERLDEKMEVEYLDEAMDVERLDEKMEVDEPMAIQFESATENLMKTWEKFKENFEKVDNGKCLK